MHSLFAELNTWLLKKYRHSTKTFKQAEKTEKRLRRKRVMIRQGQRTAGSNPTHGCRSLATAWSHPFPGCVEPYLEISTLRNKCLRACSVMSDSSRLHGLQPTRLLCPWDFPAKNTGVGCHFLTRASSQPRDQTHMSCTGRQILDHWATREAHLRVLL